MDSCPICRRQFVASIEAFGHYNVSTDNGEVCQKKTQDYDVLYFHAE